MKAIISLVASIVTLSVGIGLGFVLPATTALAFSIWLFVFGLVGSILSAWLSVRYWKVRDPFNYEMGIGPNPDTKTIPNWVSYLNVTSWIVMALSATLFFRHQSL